MKTKYVWLMDPGTKPYAKKCGGESEIDDIVALKIYKNLEKRLNTELSMVGVTYGNSKNPEKAEQVLKTIFKDTATTLGAKNKNSENTKLFQSIKETTDKEKISMIITGPATDIKHLPSKNYENIEKIITSFPIADNYKFENFLLDKALPLLGLKFDQWNLNLDPESVKTLLQKAEGKTYFYKMGLATALTEGDILKINNTKYKEMIAIKYKNHYKKFGQKGYFPWDALALAMLIDQETNQGIFKYKQEKLEVKKTLLGHKLEISDKGYEATIAYDIDKNKFKQAIIEGLR